MIEIRLMNASSISVSYSTMKKVILKTKHFPSNIIVSVFSIIFHNSKRKGVGISINSVSLSPLGREGIATN